jgi:hypothetical protein
MARRTNPPVEMATHPARMNLRQPVRKLLGLQLKVDNFVTGSVVHTCHHGDQLNARVAYWPKADIVMEVRNVRFRGNSGHRNLRAPRPLLTRRRHLALSDIQTSKLGSPNEIRPAFLLGRIIQYVFL